MADGFVHTVHDDGSWVNGIEGDEAADLAPHATKHVAAAAGRDEAIRRKTEHVIHNEDGSIASATPTEATRRTGLVDP